MILKIIFFLLFSFYHAEANDNNELIFHNSPKKIEALNLKKLDGTSVNLRNISNNYLIINFWATWCPPCIKEIPDLLEIQEKFKDKIKLVFISIDSSPEKVIPNFIKKNKFKNFDVYTDQQFLASKNLNIKIMPTTIIVNKELFEIARITGYAKWLDKSFIKKIEEL
tara:strand:- start:331 stop:831 length:501 start_codon:yes stop_codon:yes gene_type:complete